MKLTVIIVTHNNAHTLPTCLTSLQRAMDDARARMPLQITVIVVDNASHDRSVEVANSLMEDAHILPLSENRGFSRAVNLAAAQDQGHLWLLNPDAFPAEDALFTLLHTFREYPDVAAVGPALIRPDGVIAPEGARAFPTLWHEVMDKTGLAFRRAGWPLIGGYYLGEELTPRPVPVLSGAALLVRREAWDAVGGLDETFWLYGEDTDLCTRLGRQGWRCFYQPRARVIHLGGASGREENRLMLGLVALESMRRYFHIHRGRRAAILYRVLMMLLAAGKWGYWILRGDPAHVRVQQAIMRWARTGEMNSGVR